MKQPKFELPYPMVLVMWEDSKLLFAGWIPLQVALDDAQKGTPIISTGFLLESTKHYIVLVSSMDLDHEGGYKVSEVVKIPRSQITKIHRIHVD